ncbi:SlyX family protein [Thiopseudomonas alkaliphila]|uniref:SlyX family protein n=1 Tax=Thiopseudomonas alkaliphila TaxID=1697053 RepID=UPI002575D3F7|nr:SlyX family protein [Thiopseudomonas alkaliphila]MDM1717407.1 SlyX family protein [Thiopseudomonas alkaliphila]
MSIEQRLAELEIRQAFQDDTIQALNDVIASQQIALEKMQRQVQLLAQRQAEMKPVFELADNEPPPPHY